ncbi:hypothetical protein HK096_005859, partial [Nowakowskiella sp. JEL0078]
MDDSYAIISRSSRTPANFQAVQLTNTPPTPHLSLLEFSATLFSPEEIAMFESDKSPEDILASETVDLLDCPVEDDPLMNVNVFNPEDPESDSFSGEFFNAGEVLSSQQPLWKYVIVPVAATIIFPLAVLVAINYRKIPYDSALNILKILQHPWTLLISHLLTVKTSFNYSPIISIVIALLNPLAAAFIALLDLVSAILLFFDLRTPASVPLNAEHLEYSWRSSVYVQWQAACAAADNSIFFVCSDLKPLGRNWDYSMPIGHATVQVGRIQFFGRMDVPFLFRKAIRDRVDTSKIGGRQLAPAAYNLSLALDSIPGGAHQVLNSRRLHQWINIAVAGLQTLMSSAYAVRNGIPAVNDMEFIVAMYALASIVNLVTKILWVSTVGIVVVPTNESLDEIYNNHAKSHFLYSFRGISHFLATFCVWIFAILVCWHSGFSYSDLGKWTVAWMFVGPVGFLFSMFANVFTASEFALFVFLFFSGPA